MQFSTSVEFTGVYIVLSDGVTVVLCDLSCWPFCFGCRHACDGCCTNRTARSCDAELKSTAYLAYLGWIEGPTGRPQFGKLRDVMLDVFTR